MRTITVIAKGPSAAHAAEFIAMTNTDVASINNAALLVPGQHIDYCFFTDSSSQWSFHEFSDRVGKFVTPSTLPVDKCMEGRVIHYKESRCAGSTQDLIDRVASGGICHHNTVNGAIHWLAKIAKYDRIRIIGVDGGRSYAPGVTVVSSRAHKEVVEAEGTLDYFDIWKGVTEGLCEVVKNVYGTRIEWHEH